MCGIAGTVYNRAYIPGFFVDVDELSNLLVKIKMGEAPCSSLLDLAWKYKSNVNFIRFCKSASERERVQLLCEQLLIYSEEKKSELPLIDKSSSLASFKQKTKDWECLADVHWFLSSELNKSRDLIESLAARNLTEISDASLILFRDIVKIIHAIDNRLELRGRDSFGLSISLTSPHFMKSKLDHDNINGAREEIFFSRCGEGGTYSFVFKACNSIGGLGDNAHEIKNLIRNNEFFLDIITGGLVTSATIMGHTRWASVGKVSFDNTHPIALVESTSDNDSCHILTCLNGDIYNYKEVISNTKKTQSFSKDTSICTSDCLAASAYLLGKKNISTGSIAQMSNDLTGSYAISVQHSDVPEKLFLVKKGIQGLYAGFSYDGILFASDVYGLVETCKYFVPIDSDIALELCVSDIGTAIDPKVSFLNLKTGAVKRLKSHDLRITNITTRDIDKRGYQHFLEKEIYETRDVVEKTINAYLQPEKIIDNTSLHLAINISETQIPFFLVEKFKNGDIKKVIITGMGTCYTAAVAISMYMRASLKLLIPDIVVEPHVASEGSAFYIEPNMQDTLVIVIAQSGTTVDTNVYVQMAKERGATSLAIANKREGDVTFIVDGTCYIGEGRDIEIAVPSTKTYTAQVVLGYLVSVYLASNIAEHEDDKQKLLLDIHHLRHLTNLIDESFLAIKKIPSFKNITKSALAYQSWYVIRDGSTNSVCADEIRIKYSENCYHSVASITLTEATRLDIKNSFLILMTEHNVSELAQSIRELVDEGNILVLVSINGGKVEELQALIERGSLYILRMPDAPEHFSFIPTIIAGQFLSYFQAVEQDKRTQYFEKLLGCLDSRLDLQSSIKELGSAVKSGYLNQGYSVFEIMELHRRLECFVSDKNNIDFFNDLSDLLLALAEQSRRTIDTIKHQAKTITVGAVRDSSSVRDNFEVRGLISEEKLTHQEKKLTSLEDLVQPIEISEVSQRKLSHIQKSSEILISFDGLDESIAYNVINIIKDYNAQVGIERQIRLAQPYDHQKNQGHANEYWIILRDGSSKKSYAYLGNDQNLIFDFSNWNPGNSIRSCFGLAINSCSNYAKAIWSISLGVFLSRELVSDDEKLSIDADKLRERIDLELLNKLCSLASVITYLHENEEINEQVAYASMLFLTRKNWKTVGSGANFNSAKYAAKHLMKEMSRACAFDVLENHKHIDLSAESAIFVFICGIWKHGYQEDALSEIQKMLAHNSLPIIVTEIHDNRFDNASVVIHEEGGEIKEVGVPVIKLPKVSLNFSYPLNVMLLEKITDKLKMISDSNNIRLAYKTALISVDVEAGNANLWK